MRTSLVLAALLAISQSDAAVITWTNVSGGNWNTAANWNPNQVPAAGDSAVITNAGTYTVTLNTDPMIAGLIVGGSSGNQSVATAGNILTLNGEGDVNSSGRLLLSGGALSGTNQIRLAGALTWSAGAIDTNAAVTVVSGGSVTLASGGNTVKYLHGSLTNGGVVTWRMYGSLAVGGTLHNLAGALFETQVTNRPINKYGDNALIVNDGIVRKSTDSGDLACSVPLHNSGTVDTLVGTLTLTGGSVCHSGSTFIGAGKTRLDAGTHRLDGDLYATNLVLYNGAALAGNARLNGLVTWDSGTIIGGAAMTVAAGSHLLLSSGGNNRKQLYGSLTNAGTVTFSPYGGLYIAGTFHNLAGALFDVQTTYNGISKADSAAVIINEGVLRRSSTSDTVSCEVPIINHGTVEALSGALSITGDFTNPQGTIALAGGNITLSQPLVMAGGLLTGWGIVDADVTNAACVRPSCSNGVLTINGQYHQRLDGRLELELGSNTPGTNQSQLKIIGAATLGGTVGVLWRPGYTPSPGTNFLALTFASHQGEFGGFDNCILLGQGRRLEPVYTATNFTLATVAASEPTSVPLHVVVGDGGALVHWPMEFPGYELYGSTNLSVPNWTLLAGATNRWFESPPLPREHFFWLRSP